MTRAASGSVRRPRGHVFRVEHRAGPARYAKLPPAPQWTPRHGVVHAGATFAEAAAEWLRFIEEDRVRKPSTLAD